MQIPSRLFRLHDALEIPPREVDTPAWQAHLLKHPFGIGAIRGSRQVQGARRWNHEGWDRTEPVVLTEQERRVTTSAIAALASGGRSCAIDDLARVETDEAPRPGRMPCYRCMAPLVELCAAATGEIAGRYAAFVGASLAALEDSVVVDRQKLASRVCQAVARKQPLPTVATAGWLVDELLGLRINRPDGVRTELDWPAGASLRWRTTYRTAIRNANDARNAILCHAVRAGALDPLSGNALVPRRWWENDNP